MPKQTFVNRSAFERALLSFINGPLLERHGDAHVRVSERTPLFTEGVIDSLGILDLLVFIEQATGRPIPLRRVDMRYFASVRAISESFWNEEKRAAP